MTEVEREITEARALMPPKVWRKLERWASGDAGMAREQFRRYGNRAAAELPTYRLNYLTHRIAMLLDGPEGAQAVDREIEEE